ncbi:MAG: class I mannose-6-phosphate isomerase [Phycisphaerales bacterium]|nr:class I mannose-6-phosphate isomerase [Phycisphaerales bacterium]
MHPYPLLFEPILKEKVWGGHRLEALGKRAQEDPETISIERPRIGESWELADLDATSADGGGGGAARSMIANGPMRGLSIRDAITAMGSNLMGQAKVTQTGGFPLLAKFLDADENLSVQVHPSEAYAKAHPDAHLKTESWYIVHAEPGAMIYKGLRSGVSRQDLEAHIRAGTVAQAMQEVPVQSGDFHHLPSGMVHALGAGVVVAEVQTPSDTTFRLYDWGRTGRAMHIEQALACIAFGQTTDSEPVRGDGSARRLLHDAGHFLVKELRGQGGEVREHDTSCDLPVVVICIEGEGQIEATDDGFAPVRFKAGTTLVSPARLDAVRMVLDRDSTLLEVLVRG